MFLKSQLMINKTLRLMIRLINRVKTKNKMKTKRKKIILLYIGLRLSVRKPKRQVKNEELL